MDIRRITNSKTGECLEIFADPPTPDSVHGNIREIPYLSDDRDTAEFLAGELARNSRLVSDEDFQAARAQSVLQGD
jgi:hypothetical protein